jgi:hypothetical protein
MNKIDLAYIAGFFDGEGYVGILKRQRKDFSPEYYIMASVGQNDGEIMDILYSNFGGVLHHVKRDGSYQWNISYEKAYKFLKKIHPYLKYKKPQVDVAVRFYENSIPDRHQKGMGGRLKDTELQRREDLFLKLKALKRIFAKSTYCKHKAGSTTERVKSL